MLKTTTARRRVLASLTAAAVVLAGSVTFLAAPAVAADRTIALVDRMSFEDYTLNLADQAFRSAS